MPRAHSLVSAFLCACLLSGPMEALAAPEPVGGEDDAPSVKEQKTRSEQIAERRRQAVPPPSYEFITRADNRYGVFMTSSNAGRDDFLRGTLDRLSMLGANAFIFDVKGNNVYFETDAALAHEFQLVRPLYDIQEVIRTARERGFYTIARFIALKDPVLAKRRPDARIHHPVTGISVGGDFVDGSSPVVLEYNRQILESLARAGVDEINFDYIRYPTQIPSHYIGLTGEQRADRIEQFLIMARRTINAVRPETKLGISTFAILGWDFESNVKTLGQDVVRFAPLVDVISPMAYPSSFSATVPRYQPPRGHSRPYHLVLQTLEGYKRLLGAENHRKIRPWLQGFDVTTKQMRDQMLAVYGAGLCGFMVWNAPNKYDFIYPAMKDLPYPEHCRGKWALELVRN